MHPVNVQPGDTLWMARFKDSDGRWYQAQGHMGRAGTSLPFFSCEGWARMCIPATAVETDVYPVVVGSDMIARRLKPTPEAYRHRLSHA